ncbi:uncharacterized protein [Physcomitrium patens]|uniref:uncharacterized protein isoform X2 n=1 Tax=Physcomitrium patens TaxID=3218 RepID=UPI000D153248|nr:uncharacterized protein LOC112272717 isoform X2 [Physcomitrium patens]|eukprot:XP_024356535.1 uncharacterized protein LOC112272717 isoform X2 [Physcomitrella patens]
MAATAILPSLSSTGVLLRCSSSCITRETRVAALDELEPNSCFGLVLSFRVRESSSGAIGSLARSSLAASSSFSPSSSCKSPSSSSSSRFGARRSSRPASRGRKSFLRGGNPSLFMIQRLACACNGDKQRQKTICSAVDKGLENAVCQMNGGSHNGNEQPHGISTKRVLERWDVVGLGQAMVGYGQQSEPCAECCNDWQCGQRPFGGFLQELDSIFAACLFRAKLQRANVCFLSQPVANGTTGTVIVLTSPDAQRTMLSYQGMSSTVSFDPVLAGAIAKSRVLIVEGYLWEISQTIEAIAQACDAARRQGVLVALTASDVSCVTRHRPQFWSVMRHSSDILFANADEARALCASGEDITLEQVTKYLNHFCPLVSVTDGARGSYIGLRGEVVFIPPAPCVPVDTCGAGDAYAAGVLYGLLRGVPELKGIGYLAARVAAIVVGQLGTRITEEVAVEFAESVNRLYGLPDSRIMELMGMKEKVPAGKTSNVVEIGY